MKIIRLGEDIEKMNVLEKPKAKFRMLNHCDTSMERSREDTQGTPFFSKTTELS